MKTTIRAITMATVLAIAGISVANAQRGMGRMMHDTTRTRMMMRDSVRMGRPGGDMMMMRHMNPQMQGQMSPGGRMGMGMGMGMGPWARGGMRPGMGWGSGPGFRGGMGWGPGPGFRGGMGPGRVNRQDFGQRPGPAGIESIPNLTDKQKKDIADLRQKQTAEVKKIREDSMTRIKTLQDEHRKKIMSLLTDEQKKYLEGIPGAPAPDTKKPQK
jgi:hypothetical protein